MEPLLFKGFIYTPAIINDVSFVFKSLNSHEFETLNFMLGGITGRQLIKRQYNLFLAFGVLMVDGRYVLSNREDWLDPLAELFAELNEGARRRVLFQLSEINRRATRAVLLTEAYAMEQKSRLRWAQFRGLDPISSTVTGIAGTEHLGLNWGQLIWRALNYIEDLKENNEREWENAKFIASAMVGKGMNKIHSQDRQRRRAERNEMIDRRDKVLRTALIDEAAGKQKSGVQIQAARTVEELAEQLEKDLKGEQDFHDRVVQEHEQRARSAHEQRLAALRGDSSKYVELFGDSQLVGLPSDNTAGLSAEEVRFRIERRRQLMAQTLASRQFIPELDEKASARFEKWSYTKPLTEVK